MRIPDRAGRGELQGFRAAVSRRTMHDPTPEWVKNGNDRIWRILLKKSFLGDE
jgi:hypothetical protein